MTPVGSDIDLGALWRSLAPGDDDADVPRQAARKVDDLIANAIASWLEIIRPKLEDLLGNARKGLFPTRFLLINRPPPVGAQEIRKSIDLNFREAVSNGTLDHG